LATITCKAINGVNNLKALDRIIQANLLLNAIDELEPEFLIIYSYFAYEMALRVIHDLAEIAVSIAKDIIGMYSGAAGAMFFLADSFWGESESESEGIVGNSMSSTHAKIAQNEDEFNSQNSVTDLLRGRQFENAVLGVKGLAKTAIRVGGRLRVPDFFNLHVLEEVKSVTNLRYTKQLKDYFAFCQANGMQMVLHFDKSRLQHVSSEMMKMWQTGDILLVGH